MPVTIKIECPVCERSFKDLPAITGRIFSRTCSKCRRHYGVFWKNGEIKIERFAYHKNELIGCL